MATRFLDRLTAKYRHLADFPEIGAPRDQLRPGLRVLIFRDYASYYRIEGRTVVIVRVLHGHRDIAALAARGGFDVS